MTPTGATAALAEPVLDHAATLRDAAQSILDGIMPARIIVPGLDQADTQVIWDGLARFGAESTPEEKKLWKMFLPRDPKYVEEDDGIIEKTGQDGSDRKLYLHYRADTRALLVAHGVNFKPWHEDWLAACHRRWVVNFIAAVALAREMDRIRPGKNFEQHVLAACEQHTLRGLMYAAMRGTIGKVHTDRNGWTQRNDESSEGLYALPAGKEGEKVPFELIKAPYADVFTGDQLMELAGIPALEHGVESQLSDLSRFALVFFVKIFGLLGVGTP